jgi:mRNA-degrading endonuclease RelE of RelBE toxin-antitoxin system
MREIALSTKFVKKLKKLTPEQFNKVSLAMDKFQKGEDETLGTHSELYGK